MTSIAPEGRNVDIPRVLDEARAGTLRWLAEEHAPYEDDVRGPAEALLTLLEERGIDFVLVGGLAVLQWVEGRNTIDIDLLMAEEDAARIPELAIIERDRDFIRAEFHGLVVDVLLTANPLFDLVAMRHAVRREFGRREIQCATPEGLILLKLFALPSLYRQGRGAKIAVYEGDIRSLLAVEQQDSTELLDQLRPYLVDSDIAELRRLTAEIAAAAEGVARQRFGPPHPDDPKPA